jgi:hypothetical protein
MCPNDSVSKEKEKLNCNKYYLMGFGSEDGGGLHYLQLKHFHFFKVSEMHM